MTARWPAMERCSSRGGTSGRRRNAPVRHRADEDGSGRTAQLRVTSASAGRARAASSRPGGRRRSTWPRRTPACRRRDSQSDVDDRGRPIAGIDHAGVVDVVALPRRRVLERRDHGVPIHHRAVRQDHQPVVGHQVAVERRAGAVAQRVPATTLEIEQDLRGVLGATVHEADLEAVASWTRCSRSMRT